MSVHVVIPFRDLLPMTAALVRALPEAGRVWLLDNGSAGDIVPLLGDAPAMVLRCPGATISEMWNRGWELARAEGAAHVAFLNNDVEVRPGFLPALAAALEANQQMWCVCPDQTAAPDAQPTGAVRDVTGKGVARDGGLLGWAFVLRADASLRRVCDEQFEWWYTDNDLGEEVMAAGGRVGVVEGLYCKHNTSTTWKEHPELHPTVAADGERFRRKWRPKFSVIMPTYRRPHTLPRAIDSVLAQEYPLWQLVVVDNAGDVKGVPADERIHLARHTGRAGAAYARNTGLSYADGDFVVFADDDDVMMPWALYFFARAFREHPGAKLVRAGFLTAHGDPWWELATPSCAVRREFATPTWDDIDYLQDRRYWQAIIDRHGWTEAAGDVVRLEKLLCVAFYDQRGGLRAGHL